MISEIYVAKSEFLQAIEFIKFPYARDNKALKALKFTIELFENTLVLNTLGAYGSPLVCHRNNSEHWNIELPFMYIYSVVKNSKNNEINISFENNKLKFENVTIAGVKITKRENNTKENNASKIELPFNYTDIYLLNLRPKYTENVINQNGLVDLIEKAESRLENNLKAAVKYLKIYGLSYEELKELIKSKIIK
jgi:hypothetical protein